MKIKKIFYFIIGIIIIIGLFFIFRNNNIVAEESQGPKINYQSDPNFAQLHPKGNQFSVEITGEEMNLLTLEENALIWEVDIDEFVNAFNLKFNTNAKSSDKLGNVLPDYKNSNRDVKILLDSLK